MADKIEGNVDGIGLVQDGNHDARLTAQSFNNEGEILELSGDLALVMQSAKVARDFLTNKQWALLWRDADLLFQAPRPMSVYDNTYVLEPNVQRFTVAKIVNAVIPQLYKGLFYDDPPMLMRPRVGTSQTVVDAKTSLFSYILENCRFKIQTKWGMEIMATFGTGIWKWGIDWKEVITQTRKATAKIVTTGPQSVPTTDTMPKDVPPDITTSTQWIPLPFFEHRPLDKVLVDPKLAVSDIRESDWVIDTQFMDFYQMKDIMDQLMASTDKDAMKGWSFPKDLKDFWANITSPKIDLSVENATMAKGAVHHAETINAQSPDPLRTKLEVLEYWDRDRKILVLNGTKTIYSGENQFHEVPFLSANWWNRPKAFYGMGLGLIVGQNQRVDQGTINSILKMLSYGVNPIWVKKRDSNTLTQMVSTKIGKVVSVDGDDPTKAFHLMEMPKVPPDIWSAIKESEQATESTSGADQQLVQGSTSGPRSSMGRTSGGAAIQASASATRMDGPLDNFVEQVFKPFLKICDKLVFKYMSDFHLLHILGKQAGPAMVQALTMQEYWDANIGFEVLAGASMSAKRTMAQSMVMLTQILDNPQIQQSLADINEEYIDFKPIIRMWMEASEWKNGEDIIKPMTQAMKDKRKAESSAAQMQAKAQMQQQQTDQKFAQKQQLEDQSSNNRIKRDLTIAAAKASGLSEAVSGQPSSGGIQGQLPTVA